MKQFSCGDVVPGCGRTFSGDQAAVLAAVADHARLDHGLPALPPSLVDEVLAHLHEV